MGDDTPIKPIQVPVEVVVDFTGITYDATDNRWTVPGDAPAFSLKDKTGKGVGKTIVLPGSNTILWTVTAKGNIPSDLVASLPDAGVKFDAKDNPPWPNKQPAVVPTLAMAYSVVDNFNPGSNETYGYTITVRLTSTTTPAASIDFAHDPEVENQGSNMDPVTG